MGLRPQPPLKNSNCPECRFARSEIANSTYTKKEFNPMDFVHGRGNGKEEVGLRPTTRWGRKAPDPMSGFTAYKTGHNLGSYEK